MKNIKYNIKSNKKIRDNLRPKKYFFLTTR